MKKNQEIVPVIESSGGPAYTSNKKLFSELKVLADKQKDVIEHLKSSLESGKTSQSVNLLGQLQSIGLRHSTMSRFNSIALGQIFQTLKETWDTLPQEFTQAYSDYYDYIQQIYGYGDQMADMYAAVWEAWFSGRHLKSVPDFVDVSKLPVVKMRVAASYIMRDEMNKTRWRILSDETLTRSELSAALRGHQISYRNGRPIKDEGSLKKIGKGKKIREKEARPRSHLVRETGDLRMIVNGQIETVGFMNIKSSNPLVLAEIKRILIMADIRTRR